MIKYEYPWTALYCYPRRGLWNRLCDLFKSRVQAEPHVREEI